MIEEFSRDYGYFYNLYKSNYVKGNNILKAELAKMSSTEVLELLDNPAFLTLVYDTRSYGNNEKKLYDTIQASVHAAPADLKALANIHYLSGEVVDTTPVSVAANIVNISQLSSNASLRTMYPAGFNAIVLPAVGAKVLLEGAPYSATLASTVIYEAVAAYTATCNSASLLDTDLRIKLCTYLGLSTSTYPTFASLLASSTAMNIIAASVVAMAAIYGSGLALKLLLQSTVAKTAITTTYGYLTAPQVTGGIAYATLTRETTLFTRNINYVTSSLSNNTTEVYAVSIVHSVEPYDGGGYSVILYHYYNQATYLYVGSTPLSGVNLVCIGGIKVTCNPATTVKALRSAFSII